MTHPEGRQERQTASNEPPTEGADPSHLPMRRTSGHLPALRQSDNLPAVRPKNLPARRSSRLPAHAPEEEGDAGSN